MRHTIESPAQGLARMIAGVATLCLPGLLAVYHPSYQERPLMSTTNSYVKEMTMSWKAEVIADSSGKWVSDTVRFATQQEAWSYLQDLTYRWTAVRYERVVESNEPVNHRWTEHGLLPNLQNSQQ
jgi:hypothetical protein